MSNHNILPWAMTTKANIQLLGWWLVLFAYVVLVGLWDLVLLNCHRPELPSGEQQSRKGPSDLFISDITILHSGAGASNGRSNSVKRQRQHLQRLWPLPSLPSHWSQEPHSGSWSPMVTREAELCVCGGHKMCFNAKIVNVRQRHSTTLVKCDNQSE